MSAGLGSDLRIKYDSTGVGTTFALLAGAKTDDLTINGESPDITDKDDSGWRTKLGTPGTRSIDATVEGVLKDATMIGLLMSGDIVGLFEIDVIGLGSFEGNFELSSIQLSGSDGAEAVTFTASLASSGAITWTAA